MLFCQVSLKKISQKLKEFRPSATVLEAEVASARRGGDIGSVGVTPANEPHNFHAVMKRKRLSHDDTIKVHSSFLNDAIIVQELQVFVPMRELVLHICNANSQPD